MAGIVFPNIGNALLPLMQMDRQREQDEWQKGRLDRQDALHAQERADNLAFRKEESQYRREALDEQRAMRIQNHIATLDEKTRAKVKEFSEFRSRGGMAVLSAPTEQQAQAYAMYVQEAKQRGYDMSLFPQQWDKSTAARLQFDVDQSMPFAEFFSRPQAMPPVGGGAPAAAPGGTDINRAGGAIAGIESVGQPNGGYGAIGPQTKMGRAYGKYQVMDFNVGPWTTEVLGKPMTPQEFLANPQAQDAVFKAKFGQLAQKHGPEGAARAWFAGEGGMNNPNASDVNGMTVAGYGQKFNKGYGGPQVAQAGGFTPTNMPAESIPGGLPQMPPQGDAVAGQGDVMTPPRAVPPEVDVLRQIQLPPGAAIALRKGKPTIQDGRIEIIYPGGQLGYADLPAKPAGPPSGYRPVAGGLEPVPGGPADPARVRAEKVPSGYRDAGDGTYTFIPGGPADPAIVKRASPMNNEQARDAGFADRMLNSNGLLEKLDTQGTNLWQRFSEKAPGGLGSFAQTPEYQQFLQAKADFINAQLRRESGAAISKDEFDKADRQYFPQPGDKPEVIAQKAKNRQLAVDAMIRGAGPTYKPGEGVTGKPAPKGGDREKLLFDARKAIEQGAPRDAVIKRLREMGVEGEP